MVHFDVDPLMKDGVLLHPFDLYNFTIHDPDKEKNIPFKEYFDLLSQPLEINRNEALSGRWDQVACTFWDGPDVIVVSVIRDGSEPLIKIGRFSECLDKDQIKLKNAAIIAGIENGTEPELGAYPPWKEVPGTVVYIDRDNIPLFVAGLRPLLEMTRQAVDQT